MEQQTQEPMVVLHGEIADDMVPYARDKLLELVAKTGVPVLETQLRLDHHADPARPGANHVEMNIDLDGRWVRARCSARSMNEAIDGALARLRRRVEAATERAQSLQFRHRDHASWHHDDVPAERPPFYDRPVEDRVLLRRKTFALGPESIEEALFDLEVLDHDFFLFVHADTGREAVVYRVDGGYGVMQREATPEAIAAVEMPMLIGPEPGEMDVDDAIGVLDASGEPFVFFVDTERGQVVYRRYDGNYGLIGG